LVFDKIWLIMSIHSLLAVHLSNLGKSSRFVVLFMMSVVGGLLSACNIPLDFLQAPGGVLFQDDFSQTIAQWQRADVTQASSDYVEDSYRIRVNQPNLRVVSTAGLYFEDVQIEVDAQKKNGSEHNLYGIICRYQNEANYDALLISSDGYYGIFANVSGKFGLIGVELMAASNAIHGGLISNHLSARCTGNQLSLAMNGRFLTSQVDEHFSRGDIGLLVGSLEEDGVEVWFDNLSVIKP